MGVGIEGTCRAPRLEAVRGEPRALCVAALAASRARPVGLRVKS